MQVLTRLSYWVDLEINNGDSYKVGGTQYLRIKIFGTSKVDFRVNDGKQQQKFDFKVEVIKTLSLVNFKVSTPHPSGLLQSYFHAAAR
jgi:hypothetical protein